MRHVNGYAQQSRHVMQLMGRYAAYARSLGCKVMPDGIEATPRQVAKLQAWWKKHSRTLIKEDD
jgi:hypothetical protein